MMRSVFTKTIYEKRWFIFGWTVGMIALAMLMTSFYPAMHQDGSLDALVKNMPPAFQGLVGDLANLRTFETYIASQLFDIRVPLIAGVMAIILGLGLSTREEEDGELRTMVSLPISRRSLLLQKWFAMLVIMAIAAAGLLAGIYIIVPFLTDATIEFTDALLLVMVTWLVMITYGTVTYGAGMITGRRSLTSFIGIVVIIGSFLLSTFSQAVDWLSDYEYLSLLHYFPAVDIIKNGINWGDAGVLSAISLGVLAVAWFVFDRRDIH
jgi:ABC-2 type transport system permease protein